MINRGAVSIIYEIREMRTSLYVYTLFTHIVYNTWAQIRKRRERFPGAQRKYTFYCEHIYIYIYEYVCILCDGILYFVTRSYSFKEKVLVGGGINTVLFLVLPKQL